MHSTSTKFYSVSAFGRFYTGTLCQCKLHAKQVSLMSSSIIAVVGPAGMIVARFVKGKVREDKVVALKEEAHYQTLDLLRA